MRLQTILKSSRTAVLFLAVFFLLANCASRHDLAPDLAHDAQWSWDIIAAQNFDLVTAIKPHVRQSDTLWVYIEGDGLAYVTPNQPAMDPTPTDPIALRLALKHPYDDAVAYLARPCQYVQPHPSRECSKNYWTTRRYAPKVIQDMNFALGVLKSKTGAAHLVLVGYSGGGAVAVLLAAQRKDVTRIVTVAANLDLAYWIQRGGLSPLTGSLDPADDAAAVSSIPQTHFTGGRDDVVGTDVARSFVHHLPSQASARVVEVPDFTHICCWVERWSDVLSK